MSDLIRPRFPGGPDILGATQNGVQAPNAFIPVYGEAEYFDRRVDSIGSSSQSGNPALSYPFAIRIAGTSATFIPGTLNGLLPTNIGSTFTVSGTGTEYAVLNCLASSGVISSSSLAITSTPPPVIGTLNGYPPNAFIILIHVIVSGIPFRMIGPSSLQALPIEVFRVQKTMTTPDQLPYDPYYTWTVSTP